MQEPNRIRYYITKNGEEPTVRSVRVAQGTAPADAGVETTPSHRTDATPAKPHGRRHTAGVKRFVEDALRRRVNDV